MIDTVWGLMQMIYEREREREIDLLSMYSVGIARVTYLKGDLIWRCMREKGVPERSMQV